MNEWIRKAPRARGLFGFAVLCALAVRVMIPTGFMPTQSVHGLVISLCTGQGAVKAVLPIEKTDDRSGNQNKIDGSCAFAVGLGGPLLDHPPAQMRGQPWTPTVDRSTRAIPDLTVHRLAAPPPPSQAPPARI
ncbi:hypothetical protein ASE85_18630 [Sphingobium sp. Leaf26]|nr:hypothetical protein ASE85_18630 [Sphingobium sp. Leaf26]